MYRQKIIARLGCLIATITLAISTPEQSVSQNAEASRQRALALWEEAIRAKGGRKRLESIQSFLISSTIHVMAQSGDGITDTQRLYVMPGRAWIYTNTPSFDVSVQATVINRERGLCLVTFHPAGGGIPPLSPCLATDPIKFLIEDPVIYLMETNWVRPVPVAARTEGQGRKGLDVIETNVDGLRVDFYLSPRTHLPIRLVTEWYGGLTQNGFAGELMTVKLEDYVVIDGIFMPRRVTREPREVAPSINRVYRSDDEDARYRFNVTYNPSIFDRPAAKKVKAGDWKPEKGS
jgi:hypothetical protein